MSTSAPPVLALGLSGGGDSTALLAAIRQSAPEITLHALIVDHGLREASAREAEWAADLARRLGAHAQILRWSTPEPSQGRARLARHRLLAEACQSVGASILCLAHTYEDRVETLRMRARRDGDWPTMIGPGLYDRSPVWPSGRGLVIARPFLGLKRAALRAYLSNTGVDWIDDPSNHNEVFERVRLRNAPIAKDHETALIAFSDAARGLDRDVRRDAYAAFLSSVKTQSWGGFALNRTGMSDLALPVASRLFGALALAVSGHDRFLSPAQIKSGLSALREGGDWTGGGVRLTREGLLGRDRGAVEGRADGAGAIQDLILDGGDTGVFDGRWLIEAKIAMRIGISTAQSACDCAPSPFRTSLPVEAESGLHLASEGIERLGAIRLLLTERVRSVLLPPAVPLWFNRLCTACREPVALARPVS